MDAIDKRLYFSQYPDSLVEINKAERLKVFKDALLEYFLDRNLGVNGLIPVTEDHLSDIEMLQLEGALKTDEDRENFQLLCSIGRDTPNESSIVRTMRISKARFTLGNWVFNVLAGINLHTDRFCRVFAQTGDPEYLSKILVFIAETEDVTYKSLSELIKQHPIGEDLDIPTLTSVKNNRLSIKEPKDAKQIFIKLHLDLLNSEYAALDDRTLASVSGGLNTMNFDAVFAQTQTMAFNNITNQEEASTDDYRTEGWKKLETKSLQPKLREWCSLIYALEHYHRVTDSYDGTFKLASYLIYHQKTPVPEDSIYKITLDLDSQYGYGYAAGWLVHSAIFGFLLKDVNPSQDNLWNSMTSRFGQLQRNDNYFIWVMNYYIEQFGEHLKTLSHEDALDEIDNFDEWVKPLTRQLHIPDSDSDWSIYQDIEGESVKVDHLASLNKWVINSIPVGWEYFIVDDWNMADDLGEDAYQLKEFMSAPFQFSE